MTDEKEFCFPEESHATWSPVHKVIWLDNNVNLEDVQMMERAGSYQTEYSAVSLSISSVDLPD